MGCSSQNDNLNKSTEKPKLEYPNFNENENKQNGEVIIFKSNHLNDPAPLITQKENKILEDSNFPKINNREDSQ